MFNCGLSRHLLKAPICILIFAFGFLLFLCGCETKSAQLQELESLVSDLQLTSGLEISRWSQDTEPGFTGPIYAEMRIEYEPVIGYTKEEVYSEIVDFLKNNSWKGEACTVCTTSFFSASLEQDGYPIPIRAKVRVDLDENLVSISLEHPRP